MAQGLNLADPAIAGDVHRFHGRLSDAVTAYRSALLRDPENHRARAALGHALLGLGEFSEGLLQYEARRLEAPPLNPPGREWIGEPVSGKSVVLWPEQGLGDQIMAARFALQLRDLGAKVTLVCQPPLERLFRTLPVDVAVWRGWIGLPPIDYASLIFSAPRHLGVTVDTIPLPAPFRAAHRSTGARIGVIWRGSPKHANDARRSMPEDVARELLSVPGAISLHPEVTGAGDMLDTAEIIAGLDLVITVDTAVAHLAASLGKPTWVLLPALGVDWRWLQGRSDSPWYPSARLIRQTAPGDWSEAVAGVLRDL